MPSNVTVEEMGAKRVVIRGTTNEKARMTVMLSVLSNGRKLPACLILWCQEKAG
jgi:hypothetical protein